MSRPLHEILAGPWEVHAQGDANEYALVACGNKWVIALKVNGEIWAQEQTAITAMVAAAPEMFRALKDLLVESGGKAIPNESLTVARNRALAAIAKVEAGL